MALRNPYFNGMNTGSMLSSAASGYAAAGPIGAVVSGVTNYFQQDAQTKQAVDAVNTDFGVNYDAYGRPSFDSQAFGQGIQDFVGLRETVRPGAVALRPKRRRHMERKMMEVYDQLNAGQQNYNQAETSYRDRMSQLSDYMSRQNDVNKLQNLYRFE